MSRTINSDRFPLLVLICFISPFFCLFVTSRARIASLEEELKGFWEEPQVHFFPSPLYSRGHSQWEAPSQPCSFRAGLRAAPMGTALVAGGAGDWVTTWSLGFCPLAHRPWFCKQFSNGSISIKFTRLGVCIRSSEMGFLRAPDLLVYSFQMLVQRTAI